MLTKQQLARQARQGLSSQDLSVRSPFDKKFLRQYNTLSQQAVAYPAMNPNQNPPLSPGMPCEAPMDIHCPVSKEGYARAVHTKVRNLTNPYSQCMGCHSIYNAEQNRSPFDQKFNRQYNTLSNNATVYPAMHPNQNPPLSPGMPCQNPPDVHCPRPSPRENYLAHTAYL